MHCGEGEEVRCSFGYSPEKYSVRGSGEGTQAGNWKLIELQVSSALADWQHSRAGQDAEAQSADRSLYSAAPDLPVFIESNLRAFCKRS